MNVGQKFLASRQQQNNNSENNLPKQQTFAVGKIQKQTVESHPMAVFACARLHASRVCVRKRVSVYSTILLCWMYKQNISRISVTFSSFFFLLCWTKKKTDSFVEIVASEILKFEFIWRDFWKEFLKFQTNEEEILITFVLLEFLLKTLIENRFCQFQPSLTEKSILFFF